MDLNHKKKDYLTKIKEKYQIQNFYKVYKKIGNNITKDLNVSVIKLVFFSDSTVLPYVYRVYSIFISS